MSDPRVVHTLKGFIEFFEAIPKEDWAIGHTTEVTRNGHITHCALGHMHAAEKSSGEIVSLSRLLRDVIQWDIGSLPCLTKYITSLNDGSRKDTDKYGDHPKDRVVNVLKKRLEKETHEQPVSYPSDQGLY